jgi:hypothetical protein
MLIKKSEMRQNLHTGKIFLSMSANYRVYYIKMARIFQQCAIALKKSLPSLQ